MPKATREYAVDLSQPAGTRWESMLLHEALNAKRIITTSIREGLEFAGISRPQNSPRTHAQSDDQGGRLGSSRNRS